MIGISKDILNMIANDKNVSRDLKKVLKVEEVKEKEFCFNFRGETISVEAQSKESAYGYFYSTYPKVTESELNNAYKGEINETI